MLLCFQVVMREDVEVEDALAPNGNALSDSDPEGFSDGDGSEFSDD